MKPALAALVTIAVVSAGCASSSSSPRPPKWLEQGAASMVKDLGDPDAKVSYRVGPAPLVIVEGHLTCPHCSGPVRGARTPKGSIAVSRYDGFSHQGRDFTFGRSSVHEMVAGLCRAYGPSCKRGGRGVPKVLSEGVSSGSMGRVTRYSDAEAERLAHSAHVSWGKAIRTRAERWPQYRWENPKPAAFQRSVERFSQRYGFSSVERLVWREPRQLAPVLVFRTTHYVAAGRAVFQIVNGLRGYEGYYVEADDERGIPFIYVSHAKRGPSSYGRSWARSDAVAPFAHL